MSRDARTPAYAFYGLGALFAAYVLAFADRQILNLLVDPIKHQLRLSDLQVSLLQGPAFALFLSLAGLPIGRLIDRGRRLTVLAAGIAVWSLACAAGGAAPVFAMLLACRVGVGAGEAVMTPSAYSLFGDWFSPARQGLAAGLYSTGVYFGSGLALIAGGALVAYGGQDPSAWRSAFVIAGLAGLPVALWIATLREPERRAAAADLLPLGQALAAFRGPMGRAAAVVNAAVAIGAMATYALSAWMPSALIRGLHARPAEVGFGLGLTVATAGVCGTFSAGLVGDALRRRGLADGRLLALGLAAALAAPLAALAPVAPSLPIALALFWPLTFLVSFAGGCGPPLLQDITPNRMRGLQHALAVLAVNLIGLGLGPPVVALVTDAVLKDERKVGLGLASAAPAMLALAAAVALLGRSAYRQGLAHKA